MKKDHPNPSDSDDFKLEIRVRAFDDKVKNRLLKLQIINERAYNLAIEMANELLYNQDWCDYHGFIYGGGLWDSRIIAYNILLKQGYIKNDKRH